MVGRKGAVAQEDLFDVFLSFENDIVENNRVVAPSSEIWNSFHKNYFPSSNPKAIYSACLRWWSKKVNLENEANDANQDDDDEEFEEISMEEQDDSFRVNTTDSFTSERINFNIYLSSELWTKISPVPVRYNSRRERNRKRGSRTYMTLKKGVWTNFILEKIEKHRKNIICNWSFERCKVYVTGKNYIVISAKCVNCGSKLRGFIKERPEEKCDAVKVCFSVTNFNEKLHDSDVLKTVKNTGSKIQSIQESSKSALGIHQQMASVNIPMFGKSNGRTISLNAIRCAKARKKSEKKLSDCPFKGLSYLKAMNIHANTIHMIGMDPLVVLYTSPNQLRLFGAYKKKNSYIRISCDATGGLVHVLLSLDGTKRNLVLLFSLCISDGFQISVHSLITEKQDANFIKYWLDEFVRLGGSVPHEFICDMSPALLSAAVQAYGGKPSMSEYLNSLFHILNGVADTKPRCFIRIDVAHFIKDVAKCKHLKDVRLKHRDFFIRSVALMIKMRSLTQIRDHIVAVFVVAMSQTEGASLNTGEETITERYKKSIINKIKGIVEGSEEHSLITNNMKYTESQNPSDEEIFDNTRHTDLVDYLDSVPSKFTDWINDIEEEARTTVEDCDEGDRDNLMYNVAFAGFFKKLCKLLPLWSAVCCEVFESPYETSSSGNVECDFKNVKLSLKDIIPCRVDVFVDRHLQMLDGAVKIASQKYFNYVADNDSTNSSDENMSEPGSENGLDIALVDNNIRPNEPAKSTPDINDTFTPDESTDNRNEQLHCLACKNNHLPSNAHTCYICGKNVHVLPGCSSSIGQEEGFGEQRVCVTCIASGKSTSSTKNLFRPTKSILPTSKSTRSATKPTLPTSTTTYSEIKSNRPATKSIKGASCPTSNKETLPAIKSTKPIRTLSGRVVKAKMMELNQKEKWKKPIKRSHYMRPSPHWDLITNIDKKVKLGMLRNGSISKITHRVKNMTVALKNTCAFDSVVQILAGAYAYIQHYRSSCENREDKIFEIAILLAKNSNLKRINNLRANLLINTFKRTSYETVVSDLIRKTLQSTPSYSDRLKCPQCSFTKESVFPHVTVSAELYNDEMVNLEAAVNANFPKIVVCECTKAFSLLRELGDHMFIELPSCKNSKASLFEEATEFKICEIPLVLNVLGTKYVLFGIVPFKPPLSEKDIGHYSAIIRLNSRWEVYDDLRSKPYSVPSNTRVIIHCLFYVKFDSVDEEDVVQTIISEVSGNISQNSEEDVVHTIISEVSGNISQNSEEAGTLINDPESVHILQTSNEDELSEEEFVGFEHSDESLYRLYHQS